MKSELTQPSTGNSQRNRRNIRLRRYFNTLTDKQQQEKQNKCKRAEIVILIREAK